MADFYEFVVDVSIRFLFEFDYFQISMVGTGLPRAQIALPAQGLGDLRDSLTKLVDEFGLDDDRGQIRRKFNELTKMNFFLNIFPESIETPPLIGKKTSFSFHREIDEKRKEFYFSFRTKRFA